MIACQGTTQGPKIETSMFRYRPRHEPIGARTCLPCKTSDRRCEPPFAASPLAPQPDGLVRIISMAARDHASLVTHRNYNLVRTTVINSSQRRTCATMLALTSHYMATNAKHPRYARRSFGGWRLSVIGGSATGCEKRFAANSEVALGFVRAGSGRDGASGQLWPTGRAGRAAGFGGGRRSGHVSLARSRRSPGQASGLGVARA